MSVFDTFQPFCRQISREKYLQPGEAHENDLCKRVTEAVYANDRSGTSHEAYDALMETRFVPGGRILAGAGTSKRVTMINCFVMDTVQDSLDDIFRVLRESALTMQQGGGIGVDFSTLRPRGALLHRTGAEASGPLLFMDTWTAMCHTVMSAGARRGAMMACMRCDHPDIFDFIEAKKRAGRLTNFNLSVLVTDAFLEAVRNDNDWFLTFGVPPASNSKIPPTLPEGRYIYRTVRARELWDAIIKTTYDYAEPGVIFIDRVNALNNLAYCETISATNPCGEQPLPPYGDCNLGAINLAQMVDNPWTGAWKVDWHLLTQTVRTGVRFLDNVIDVTGYPLEQQENEAKAKRRIGLGVMGLANLFAMCGVQYGDGNSLSLTEKIFRTIKDAAYDASADLAKERGAAFPMFDKRFLEAPALADLPVAIKNKIREHGIRNGVLLTVAPTGTTAIFAGNVSGGIEPVFARQYTRKVLEPDGSHRVEHCYDWGWMDYCEKKRYQPFEGLEPPLGYVTHEQLSVQDHIAVMAVAQKFVDASISKTINCPKDMSFEDFGDVYLEAHKLGLKSCTTYRPSETRGAVLETMGEPYPATGKTLDDTSPDGDEEPAATHSSSIKRPEALPAVVYKVKPHEHAYYLTITDLDGRPFELFINSKEAQYSEWTSALGRMISAIWRYAAQHKIDVDFVQEELRQIHAATGGFWLNGKHRPGLVAAIGDCIDQHTRRLEGLNTEDKAAANEKLNAGGVGFQMYPSAVDAMVGSLDVCPKCQRRGVRHVEGCGTCQECGWSNCG